MNNKTVLLVGGQGFIGTFMCCDLLNNGYNVISCDNFSKYGRVSRPQDNHERFRLAEFNIIGKEGDIWLENLIWKYQPSYIINFAAKIGGIAMFHEYPYDILRDNELIMATIMDNALAAHKKHGLERLIVLSSSMVFEQTNIYPTPESEVKRCPPPLSSYGFSKLAVEYWVKAANKQYNLPYTIIRPFNSVGAYEDEAINTKEVMSGNIKLMMSHCLPDFCNKAIKKQDPFRILGTGKQIRHLTNGRDIAEGIRLAMESDRGLNEDFNISHPESITMLELAERVWKKVNPKLPFNYELEPGYEFDVQKRSPDVTKAKKLLGFEAKISIDESIDEVINYIKNKNV